MSNMVRRVPVSQFGEQSGLPSRSLFAAIALLLGIVFPTITQSYYPGAVGLCPGGFLIVPIAPCQLFIPCCRLKTSGHKAADGYELERILFDFPMAITTNGFCLTDQEGPAPGQNWPVLSCCDAAGCAAAFCRMVTLRARQGLVAGE